MISVSTYTSLFNLPHCDCCTVMYFVIWYNWVTRTLIMILKASLLSKMISIWQLVVFMLLPLKTTSSTTTSLKERRNFFVLLQSRLSSLLSLFTGYIDSLVFSELISIWHLLALKILLSDEYKNILVVCALFPVPCSFVTQWASVYW